MKSNIFIAIISFLIILVPLFVFAADTDNNPGSLADQIKAKIQKNKKISINALMVVDKGDGYFVLKGTATVYGARYLAGKITEKFPVKTIENDIEIQPPPLLKDIDIEQKIYIGIQHELAESYFEDINFTVFNGEVKLFGTVTKLGLIDKIFNEVIWIPGVRHVDNNLNMASVSINDDKLRQKILNALRNSIRLTPYFSEFYPRFMIIVKAGRVTLKGNVDTEADKLAVEQVTRSVYGVLSVTNQINIAQ
jgi:osmotically-inducible protein OsmY